MTTLTELAALLDEATGPSRELDAKLYDFFWGGNVTGEMCFARNFSDSIDASLALVERLSPELVWNLSCREGGSYIFRMNAKGNGGCWHFQSTFATDPTAPLAILKSLVAALIAKENHNG